jgi:hypothetical protein
LQQTARNSHDRQRLVQRHLEHGFSAPRKSVKRQRILETFDVFDFAPELREVAIGRAR